MIGPTEEAVLILLLIGRQLASQPKVELPHAVVVGVVGPHGRKYLTDEQRF